MDDQKANEIEESARDAIKEQREYTGYGVKKSLIKVCEDVPALVAAWRELMALNLELNRQNVSLRKSIHQVRAWAAVWKRKAKKSRLYLQRDDIVRNSLLNQLRLLGQIYRSETKHLMAELQQAKQKQERPNWGVVELVDENPRRSITGVLSEQVIGDKVFIRVDVPEETEQFVSFTRLYSPERVSAVYVMSEAAAREAIRPNGKSIFGMLYHGRSRRSNNDDEHMRASLHNRDVMLGVYRAEVERLRAVLKEIGGDDLSPLWYAVKAREALATEIHAGVSIEFKQPWR